MKPIRTVRFAALVFAALISLQGNSDDRLGNELGTVRFEVSGSPEAQTHVVRGVKLLHHMMYPEADREFAAAIATDPKCAIAYWGRAMSLIHPLWPDTVTAADRALGAEQLKLGLACPPATQREQDYLETLVAFFGDGRPGDYVAGLKAMDKAWASLAARYPEDFDALAFSALYHLAPARFVPQDKSHRIQLESATVLQRVAEAIPDHPGAQHYKIHAFDFPLLAERALEVCDTYGSIAPDVPHALHMPTHIFTRRGLWEKSIEFNLRSAEAGRKLGMNAGALNGHYPHALDYLTYAYLQRGQYREAEAIREKIAAMNGPYSPTQPGAMAFAFAAVPARCALERQDWKTAASLPMHQPSAFPWGKQLLHCDSIVRFARAIGAARSGELSAARAEIAELERIQVELVATNPPAYWISQAETQILAARAWVAFGGKDTEEAIQLMRRATEIEAVAEKEAVTPGEVLPAGDLLGDMLNEASRPAEALAAYEAVLARSPNRLNTLLGAAVAAGRAGDTAKAKSYFDQLAELTADADPGINRVEQARSRLALN
jgi:tetratricopeptide (TPR) repeat protein